MATTNSLALANRRGSGIKEDRGISKAFLKGRIPRITTIFLLARNVGRSIRGNVELELIAVTYVARKVIMPETAMLTSRTRRTTRKTRDINCMQHS